MMQNSPSKHGEINDDNQMPIDIRSRIEALQPSPNWKALGVALNYLQSGWNPFRDITMIISNLDNVTVDQLPLNIQRMLFERFVKDSPDETLYYRRLYRHRPFGREILRQAVVGAPHIAVEIIQGERDHAAEIKKLLIAGAGQETYEREMGSLNRNFLRQLLI